MRRSYPLSERREHRGRSKGQWFIISAVIAVGAFLSISLVMKDFFVVDTSDVARIDEDFHFWNVQEQFSAAVVRSDCASLDNNIKEYNAYSKKELAKKGYFLHTDYEICECTEDDPSTGTSRTRNVASGFLVASENVALYTNNIDPSTVADHLPENPGAEIVCTVAAPFCGDGTCDPGEDYNSCPADCPPPELTVKNGLVMWLKADSLSSDSPSISEWQDSSGNGNDLSQNDPGMQPTYVQNGINGQPSLEFDSSRRTHLRMDRNNFPNSAEGTIYVVFSSSERTSAFWSSSDESSTNFYIWGSGDAFGGGRPQIQGVVGGGAHTVRVGQSIFDGEAHILAQWSDGSQYDMAIDGTNKDIILINGENSGRWFNSVENRNNFLIGGLDRGESGTAKIRSPFDGLIAEFLLYERSLSEGERNRVENYLSQKYGI